MMRYLLASLLILLPLPAWGGWANAYSGTRPKVSVAELPAASAHNGETWEVIDGASASDCTVGGGATNVRCISDGAAWAQDPQITTKNQQRVKMTNDIMQGICSHIVNWRQATCDGILYGSTYVTIGICTAGEAASDSVVASTISFDASTLKISDSASGFGTFANGGMITVSGAGNSENNGIKGPVYGVTTSNLDVPEGQIVTESAGASITISRGAVPLPQQLCNTTRLGNMWCRPTMLDSYIPKYTDCETLSDYWIKEYFRIIGEAGLDSWEANEPIAPGVESGVVEDGD